MEGQIAVFQPQAGTVATLDSMALSVDAMVSRKALVHKVMKATMVEGTHFGKIPGCGAKPTLLKAGAEALMSTFRLAPRINVNKIEMPEGQREYEVSCDIYAADGSFVGQGIGTASTLEGKWKRPNPADVYNTVLKMAKKRALVDAILTVTAASDIFTQDIEEMVEPGLPAHGKKFKAPSGMDDMPGAVHEVINVDGLAKFLAQVADLAELKAEYKVVKADPRWKDSDQTAINDIFNARIARLTEEAA